MAKTAANHGKPEAKPTILLRYREVDTRVGVSRKTAAKMAKQLGMTETEVIHLALAQLAKHTLPRYAPDDGQLTAKQIATIKKIVPQDGYSVIKSLF